MYNYFKIISLLLLLLLLAGCAENKYIFNYAASDEQAEIIWPQDTEDARYRYVGQLLGEQNFVAERTGAIGEKIVNLLRWIAGVFSVTGEKTPVVLQRPQSGATSIDGRIFVTDVSKQAIYVFDTINGKFDVWKDAGVAGGFVAPVGIVVLPSGEVLVADSQLAAVIRLSASGDPQGFFAAGIMNRPTGMAYNPADDWLYIADSAAHNIKVFKSDGTFVRSIGAPGVSDGEFNAPTHLAFRDGKLFVTDSLNARIQIFSAQGDYLNKFGERGLYIGNFSRPKGITVDSDGNIYVMESYYDHMLVFNGQGEFLMPIGGTGYGIGQFYLPAGMWVDQQDRLYVADMYNGRIMIFQYLVQMPEVTPPTVSSK